MTGTRPIRLPREVLEPTGAVETLTPPSPESLPPEMGGSPDIEGSPKADESGARGVLSSSAVMAAGTVVSRLSGFVRLALLSAALGVYVHADVFTIANTIPNMLYILLAGGVFNAVLVPQLVRAMRHDADAGEAYTNRVITLAALFLAGVTALLVLAAPWVMPVFLSPKYSTPEFAAQRQSIIDFARFCLPQVFFYGMFVLVGQILNARRRFGPMMWAPIANNVISVLVLVGYLAVFGAASKTEQAGAFSPGQEALLGLGSTLGIVVQLAILVPFLKAAGFVVKPRFDFRGTGLGHTLKLGVWTVMFVLVNQVAYTVVVRLASGGSLGDGDGTGYIIYSSAFLIVMVPHSVITVSLATAVLPALTARAAGGDLSGFKASLTSTLRTALAVIVPFAALLPLIAPDLARVIVGYGAASSSYVRYAPTLALFGLGLVFFTFHYLMLRGFYALEETRTIFWIQCAVAATNIVVAVTLVTLSGPAQTSPSLVLAYAASYAVGSVLSYTVLGRRLGGLRAGELGRFLLRLGAAVVVSTGVALALALLLRAWGDQPSLAAAVLRTGAITLVDVAAFLVLARLLRLDEVAALVDSIFGPVTRRLPGRRDEHQSLR